MASVVQLMAAGSGKLIAHGPGLIMAIALAGSAVWLVHSDSVSDSDSVSVSVSGSVSGSGSVSDSGSGSGSVSGSDSVSGPPGMAWIPPGSFVVGTDDPRSMPNERPARAVQTRGFWLDRTLVTNRQFGEFVAATGHLSTAERQLDWHELATQLPPGTPRPPAEMLQPGSLVFTPPSRPVPLHDMSAWWRWIPGATWQHPESPGSDLQDRPDHPVVQVSWDDARAFCHWAGKRLPTEVEWEVAARGGLSRKRYVWGDQARPDGRHLANTFQGRFPVRDSAEDGFPSTSPVTAFPASGYGLHDMAGNTWQWCSDVYRAERSSEPDAASCQHHGHDRPGSPVSPAPATERVIKGGSFLCHPSYCESFRPSARRGSTPDTATSHIGFRCARSPGPIGRSGDDRA